MSSKRTIGRTLSLINKFFWFASHKHSYKGNNLSCVGCDFGAACSNKPTLESKYTVYS